jgi:cytochrome c peroxidase
MTPKKRMMALAMKVPGATPTEIEIALAFVRGDVGYGDPNSYDDCVTEDDEDACYMEHLRRVFPNATDDEITRGSNLALVVAEVIRKEREGKH